MVAVLVALRVAVGGWRALQLYARVRALKRLHGGVNVADADDARYFDITLTERQRRWLLRLLRQDKPGNLRKGTIEALELARPTDLPPGDLDWAEVERLAKERGCSVADVIWDQASPKEPGG